MYSIFLDSAIAWDALLDDPVVLEASISQKTNSAAYLDMTLTPEGGASVEEGRTVAEVRWDGKTLFHGRVESREQGIDGTWAVSCVSDIDRLNDVLLRPHSTDGSVGDECPSDLDGWLQWMLEQFNTTRIGGGRFDVGASEGALISAAGLSLSEDGWPSCASALQSNVLDRGGYLDFEPDSEGGGTLSLYADIHEASDQIIDFGVNMVSVSVKRTVEEQRTALIPYSGDLTLADCGEAELASIANAGFSVNGLAMYSAEYASTYGYREERYEVSGASTAAELVSGAVAKLRTLLAPQVTVECKAVDMALYEEGYDHLRVGQAVRVRSEPHGLDEYLAVESVALDLYDPSQTSYTLGVEYDTLTGQQSGYLSKLNGSINGALDLIGETKDALDGAIVGADVEKYLSDSPDEPIGGLWRPANITMVDNKYLFTRTVNTTVGGKVIYGEPSLSTLPVRNSLTVRGDFGDSVYWVRYVYAVDAVDAEAYGGVRLYGTMGGWDVAEQGPVDVTIGFQGAAYMSDDTTAFADGTAGIAVVSQKSSDILLDRANVFAYLDESKISVWVRLSGECVVDIYADGSGFERDGTMSMLEPTGTQVFDLSKITTEYESAIQQADNAIRSYVKATFTTGEDVDGKVDAAKTEMQATIDQRADEIGGNVSKKVSIGESEIESIDLIARITTAGLDIIRKVNGAIKGTFMRLDGDSVQFLKADGTAVGEVSGDTVELGKNQSVWTRVKAGYMQVLDSAGNVLSSFGSKLVELGKDSADAVIKLCGGSGVITFAKSRGISMTSDYGARIGNTDANAPFLSAGQVYLFAHSYGVTSMYRELYCAYNENSADHYYTTSLSDYNGLVSQGWVGQGVYGYIFTTVTS